MDAATPGYSWHSYLAAIGVTGKTDYLLIGEPSYFKAFGAMVRDQPLAVWKSYLRWHLIAGFAPYLTKEFVAADFDFFSTALRGTPSIRPRWKRGVTLVDAAVGEALGKLYVARYFPPATKARMDQLVDNLMAAYRQDVKALDWMGSATRSQALDKLAKMRRKIGYPSRWRDYSGLVIRRDDLVGNVIRSNEWDFAYELGKLGKPVDREEWELTPQTINAYYRPDLN